MPSGNTSLYLDVYIDGSRTYEYLRMYLVPENTRADRERNRETLQFAEAVRAKRVVEVRNGKYGFAQRRRNVRFFDYYEAYCEKRFGKRKSGDTNMWYSALFHLRRYEPDGNITFERITTDWIKGFRCYLDREAVQGKTEKMRIPLAQNTKFVYFDKLRSIVRRAYEEKIIDTNPFYGVENFKKEETERNYLTMDEVRALSATECRHETVKRAFLFSCLTGLRWSDIIRLRWGDVHVQGNFTRLIFRQKKTRGQEYLDITRQAVDCMGERRDDESPVFCGFPCRSSVNGIIAKWVRAAGINKNITFHCARHTFATLMLDIGTDLYTVSKLLGHREISTTQIYAKVLDKTKQAAIERIPDIISGEGKA